MGGALFTADNEVFCFDYLRFAKKHNVRELQAPREQGRVLWTAIAGLDYQPSLDIANWVVLTHYGEKYGTLNSKLRAITKGSAKILSLQQNSQIHTKL